MEKFVDGKMRASPAFVIALSIVSIIGFLEIILVSFFTVSISDYIDTLLLLVVGTALIFEARINQLREMRKGISSSNLNQLVTAVVGFLAIVAGILSIPQIKVEHPVFLAVKGILSIIAIIVIVVQTWFVEKGLPQQKKGKLTSQ